MNKDLNSGNNVSVLCKEFSNPYVLELPLIDKPLLSNLKIEKGELLVG